MLSTMSRRAVRRRPATPLSHVPRGRGASQLLTSSSSSPSRQQEHAAVGSHQDEPAAIAPRPPRPLLLGYEDFYVSQDGISRTLYQVNFAGADSSSRSLSFGIHDAAEQSWTVEDIHDIINSEKTFVVREQQQRPPNAHFRHPQRSPPTVDQPLAKIRVQEVKEGVEGVGTGATTWEASVVAALYFHSHPHLLRGDLLELGCGTGVGGILNLVEPILAGTTQHWDLRSVTFSDYNEKVLMHCRQNVQAVVSEYDQHWFPSIIVTHLDWYGFDSCHRGRYHTILACDCAYRHCDVEALGRALRDLLSRDHHDARIHLFGPESRAVLHEVIHYLREDLGMHVTTELIHLNRSRLRPKHNRSRSGSWKGASLSECVFSTKSYSEYLHVTASHATLENDEHPQSDID